MKKVNFKKLTTSLLGTSLACFLGTIDVALAVPLDRDYNGESRSLNIDGYCRAKYGQNTTAWANVRNGDHKWYNWRCHYVSGQGGSVGAGGVGYNSGTSVVPVPVHLNDVCNWQYGGWFSSYEAYRIGDNSGDIRCRRR